MDQVVVRRTPPYRIVMVDRGWHVMCPQASPAHAFADIDGALAFVRSDSCDGETTVEIVCGSLYMLKRIAVSRQGSR